MGFGQPLQQQESPEERRRRIQEELRQNINLLRQDARDQEDPETGSLTPAPGEEPEVRPEPPLFSFEYLFGQELPKAKVNPVGDHVEGVSQFAAGFAQEFQEFLPDVEVDPASPTPVQFLGDLRNQVNRMGNVALGSTAAAGIGTVDFLASGVGAPIARLLARSGVFPAGPGQLADQIEAEAKEAGLSYEAYVDGKIQDSAESLGVDPKTLRRLLPDQLFKDLTEPPAEGSDFGEASSAIAHVVGGLVGVTKEKVSEILQGKFTHDPVGQFLVVQGGANILKKGTSKVKRIRDRRRFLKEQIEEAGTFDVRETINEVVADSVLEDGQVTVGQAHLPKVVSELGRVVRNKLHEALPERIRPSEDVVFDQPQTTLGGIQTPRGMILPDVVRTPDGGTGTVVGLLENNRALVRKPNGFMEVIDSPGAREIRTAQTSFIRMPDPTVSGELYPIEVARAALDSPVARGISAGAEVRRYTKNPELIDALRDRSPAKALDAAEVGPKAKLKAKNEFEGQLRKHYGLDFEIIRVMDDVDFLEDPSFLSYFDANRSRWAGQWRMPLWNLSGFGIPIKAKIAQGAANYFRAVMHQKITAANKKMGVEGTSFRQRMGARIQKGVSVKNKVQEFRQNILPKVLEPTPFLKEKLGRDSAMVDGIPRRSRMELAAEALKPEIEAFLESIGSEATFESFVEGAKQIGDIQDTLFYINASRQRGSLTRQQFVEDYRTRIQPRLEKARPEATLDQVIDKNELPKRQHAWFAMHRSRPAGTILEKMADPVIQEHMLVDMHARDLYLEPLIEEAGQVQRMLEEGVTVDLTLTDGVPEVGQPMNFRPSPRINDRLRSHLEDNGFKREVDIPEENIRGKAEETYEFKGVEKQENARVYEFEYRIEGTQEPLVRRALVPDTTSPESFFENFVTRVDSRRLKAYNNFIDHNLRGEGLPDRAVSRGFVRATNAVSRKFSHVLDKELPQITLDQVHDAKRLITTGVFAKHLGAFRTSSMFKNLTQGPTLGMSLLGSKYWLKGFNALENPQVARIVDHLGTRQARAQPVQPIHSDGGINPSTLKTLEQGLTSTLALFAWADQMNRLPLQAGGIVQAIEQGKDFRPNLPQEAWNKVIRKKVKEGKHLQAGVIYAHGLEGMSQWWYSGMNRPEMYLNREFLSMFGTWPLNYLERIAGEFQLGRRYKQQARSLGETGEMAAPTGPIKNPAIRHGMRYLAASLAIWGGARSVGADLESWFWLGPVSSTVIGAGSETLLSASGVPQSGVEALINKDPSYAQRQFNEGIREIVSLSPLPFEVRDGEFKPFGGMGLFRDMAAAEDMKSVVPLIFGSGPTARARREANRVPFPVGNQ